MSNKDELAILKQNAGAMQNDDDIGTYSAKRMLVDREHYLFLAAEIARLQEAKRAALKVADERTMQNTALRQENERLRAALGSCGSWIERWTNHIGACRGGDKCTCGRSAILYEARGALDRSNHQ
jgi:hypothetical protein